jgi:hypothetical protein
MNTPTWLANSKRRHEKRTYTPLILKDPGAGNNSDAVGLTSVVRSLMLTADEQAQLRQRMPGSGPLAALDAIGKLSNATSAFSVLSAASDLTKVSSKDVQSVTQELVAIRSGVADTLIAALRQLDQSYVTSSAPGHPSSATAAPGSSSGVAAAAPVTASGPGATPKSLNATEAVTLAVDGAPVEPRSVPIHVPQSALIAPQIVAMNSATATLAARRTGAPDTIAQLAIGPILAARAPAALQWASTNQPEQLQPILELAQQYVPGVMDTVPLVMTGLSAIVRRRLVSTLFAEWLTQRTLQPCGLLFLERLEMTPGDVERGELSYSLPLAPSEKVTLAHREWSVREEQFSEFIEDSLENFSEQGVAQTDDIAMSTSTESSHNNALSMSQPVASAPGVHVTSAADATSSSGVDDTQSKDESKSQSRTVTALASTRTMKDHKVSFTVTTVSGIEDFTSHLIENKHDDKSMRIDYFKRVRKWQSDLYRYGVRLTYDVVLPDPGVRLRAREIELQTIADSLATEFSLALTASQVSIFNWESLADQYGVSLPPPPDQVRHVEAAQTVMFSTPDDVVTGSDGVKYTSHHRVLTLNVATPANYQLDNLNVYTSVQAWPGVPGYPGWISAYAGQSVQVANADSGGYCTIDWNLNSSQVPGDGQNTVFFRMQVAQSGLIKLTGTFVPTESYMEAWRTSCWTIIRDAASARWAQHRTYLRDRQTALQKQIAADDPVRLRRLEREAIMFSVLDWLFPGFEDASSVLASLPSPGSLDPGTWQQVMQYGEYIKFIQTAIDWDNVMVFLYPYFWDTAVHASEKLFLDHPDAIHREFLRAGAARVILAIQPGFEGDVVSLLDLGQLGNLPNGNRFQQAISYVTAANKAFQQTTTAGGPSENPKEPGILIGTWTDYTPSSALDIQTTLMPVALTPLL